MAIVEVIKYNGSQNILAWKYPVEEIGTWTQLIVNESQEAVLFKGGQALDLFLAGRHTLSTANIPILNKIVNLPFGGRSPFTAEVWYINKVYTLDIKWGTPSPVQLQDPKYKIFVPLRSYGQFGIQISDSRKFLTKLVGTLSVFDKDSVLQYFRGLYLAKVKDSLSTYLIKRNVSVLEINAYLDELSESLKESLAPTFDEYGIKLVNFYINDINVPEEDTAVKKLKDALAKKAEMDIIGYNYVQERSFDTLEGAATNQESGLIGAGIGLGVGVGIGGAFGSQTKGIAQILNIKENKKCPKCNAEMDGESRYCPNCGYDTLAKEISPDEDNNKTNCSKCGGSYLKSVKFCPECGKPYNPCIFCGADLKEGAVKCDVCGKGLPRTCSQCNAKVMDENAKFCPACGNKL